MAFKPQTTQDMLDSGWRRAERRHPETTPRCSSCKAEVEWWISKNGKNVPFDIVDEGDTRAARISHFATCPNADKHRGQSTARPAPAEADRTSTANDIKAQYERACETLGAQDKTRWLFNQLIDARLELARLRRSN